MRKANIFKRILSCMLVLTLIMSGLGLDLGGITKDNNVIKVEALGGGHGSNSSGGPRHGGTSAGYKGAGWRFTIVPSNSIFKKIGDKGTCADIDENLCKYVKDASLVVTDSVSSSESVRIFENKNNLSTDKTIRFYSTGDIGKIFDGINKSEFNHGKLQPIVCHKRTDGSLYITGIRESNGFFKSGGTFDSYLEKKGKEEVIRKLFTACYWDASKKEDVSAKKVLKAFGVEDFNSFLIAVEPVSIWKNDNICLSLQDCLKDGGSGSEWSKAQLDYVKASSIETPQSYIPGGVSYLAVHLDAFGSCTVDFKDNDNELGHGAGLHYTTSGFKSGFYLFGQGMEGGSPYLTSVNYSAFYDGTVLDSGTINSVACSFNMMKDKDENYQDIRLSNNTLSDNTKDMTLSRYGTEGFTEFNTNKLGDWKSVIKDTTGLSADNWNSKINNEGYINVSAGLYSVVYNGREKGSICNLRNFLTSDMVNKIKQIKISPKPWGYLEGDYYLEMGDRYEYVIDGINGDDVLDNSFPYGNYSQAYFPYYVARWVQKLTPSQGNDFFSDDVEDICESGTLDSEYVPKRNKNMKLLATYLNLNGLQESTAFTGVNSVGKDGKEGYYMAAGDEDVKKKGGAVSSDLGVSVTLMAKKANIQSRIAFATLDRETGALTYNTNLNKVVDYDATTESSFTIPNSFQGLCICVAYPNSNTNKGYSLDTNTNGSNVFTKCNGDNMVNETSLVSLASSLGISNTIGGFVTKGQKIGVGTYVDTDGKGKGYSVLVLQLKGNVTKKSELDIKDYELNYVYPSMLTDGNYAGFVNLDSDFKFGEHMESSGCNKHISHDYVTGSDKYARASSNYSGNIINKNKTLDSKTNKNILQYDKFTGGEFTTEKKARDGKSFSNITNVKFSLAVNLLRSSFGDKRVISSLTDQTDTTIVGNIDENYAKDNLDLTFGDKPNAMASATATRNSDATVGDVLKDIFEWNVYYYYNYNGNELILPHRNINFVKSYSGGCSGHGQPKSYCSAVWYNEISDTETPASWDGTRVKYDVSEKAYKYQTETLEAGVNTTKTVADSLQEPKNGSGGTSSLVSPYKIAVVHKSKTKKADGSVEDTVLSFYPEVEMRAYSTTGDTITKDKFELNTNKDRKAGGYVTSHNLLTMGEVVRKVNPSAMYVIRVNHKYDSGAEVNPAIKGSTISDSTAVGTNADAVSDGKPVIYAGGDVTVKVNPDFRLNMYGYSLDLIEPADDGKYADNSIKLRGYTGYTDIINGYGSVNGTSINVRTDWGNTYTSTDSKKEFDDWSKDILTKHLGVDMTLTVNGSGVNKVFNNFTSSLGNMDTSASVAEGVYSIKIKQGTIVKDNVDGNGYKALISQIKSDYELSTDAEAEKIFTNSDIWQTISRAVEDSSDDFNKSQTANAINSRAHWYDEEVKTFVIRRYKKENLEIKNVVVNDKIDYGAAPTADDTTASLDSYKKADAKWYMTLYLKKDGKKNTPDGFSDNTVYYNPKDNLNKTGNANTGLTSASATGSVLISEVYVNGADFVIPSASTYDMGN